MANDDKQNDGPIAKLRATAEKNPATQQLFDAGEQYVQAKMQNVVSSVGSKLSEATENAAQGGMGGKVLDAGKKVAEGKSPMRTMLEVGGKSIKDKVTGALGGGGGSGKGSSGGKSMNILEDIDVGVPIREAYNQWTEFQKFSSFSKGVTSVDKTDEVTSNWKFKVFWSNRSMKASIEEMVPDERIAWSTEGAKGTIRGVVTFHSLGPNLTKILLIIEYTPAGLFEKTGNIWRAQGRRARLDLKHFRRFIMMEGEASGEGWRGEIRDGEVVRSHEEVVEQEEAENDGDSEEQASEGDYDESNADDESGDDEDAYDDEDADEDEEDDDEDYDEDAYDEDEEDEEDEDAYDEGDDEDEDDDESDMDDQDVDEDEDGEEEAPPRRRSRRRAPANA